MTGRHEPSNYCCPRRFRRDGARDWGLLDYSKAVDFLLSLVDHERPGPRGPRQKAIEDLSRMESFLRRLGDPHRQVRAIHVTGTKGKGSTAAMCDAVLHAAGYRTGFYSSPHLHSFTERVRRDCLPIGEAEFAGLVERLLPYQQWMTEDSGLGPVTLFEYMTGMAFQCFAQGQADFQTIEVGLGGRLDATNVVMPEVSVITSISLDHTAILGDTVEEIAADKAGIIKPGAAVVVGPQSHDAMRPILSACDTLGITPVQVGKDVSWRLESASMDGQSFSVQARLGEYGLTTPLLGKHQLENAATSLAALECLRERGFAISEQAIQDGFSNVDWPGRMEVLSRDPLTVVDGAHNAYSMQVLLESLPDYFDYDRLLLVTGFSRDKNVDDMVDRLAQAGDMVFATRSRHPRSMPPGDIAAVFRSRGVEALPLADTAGALDAARQAARPGDLVLGTGSLFVVAEVREAVLGIKPELYPDLLPPDLR